MIPQFLLVEALILFFPVRSFAWIPHTDGKRRADPDFSIEQPFVNSNDVDYPWCFKGRAVMRPALVQFDASVVPESCQVLAIFGWTVGGTVALEYDQSPVGPYLEYVRLGGLAWTRSSGRVMIGQYGSRLCVSKPEAETLCRQVWNLSAETAKIEFEEFGDRISVAVDPLNDNLGVSGWNHIRQGEDSNSTGFEKLSLLWTPFIKAIWYPILPARSHSRNELPLHRLQLSGSPRLVSMACTSQHQRRFRLELISYYKML